jgi:ATP-binding cassette subfamily C (CFTR/MRP) protein 1
MKDGMISASGTYTELLSSGIDMKSMLPVDQSVENENEINALDSSESETIVRQKSTLDSSWWEETRRVAKEKSMIAAELRKKDSRSSTITSKEEKNEGDVKFDIYTYYIKAGGIFLFLGLIFFIVSGQGFQLLGSFWLSYWGQQSLKHQNSGNPFSTNQNMYYLNIFALLFFFSLICYMLRSIVLAHHRLGTSIKLHAGLLKGTLGSPISFFDKTPLGRILNRFSSDLLTIDEELSQTISQVTNSLSNVMGALAAICGATKGTFLALIVPITFFYFRVQRYFRSTNTAIARLESVSRSPIYSDFSQVLSGANTVRAYGDKERFIVNLETCVNSNSIANITQQLASQWLAIRLDLLGSLVSFFIAVVAASTNGFLPAGFVALGLTYSFQLTSYLKFLVRMVATFESQMNSVERVRHYMKNIDKEHTDNEVSFLSIPESWPSNGEIIANSIDMKYGDGPIVLKQLSFQVKSSEKIGIAGRTGSGKSSLITALFRIQDISAGSIIIDGLDIATLPLKLLRSKLGIIPQDPVMFSASIRFNLDPFNNYSDERLWTVLESINMKEHVSSLPNKLEDEVAEGGDNFSAGQRQVSFFV